MLNFKILSAFQPSYNPKTYETSISKYLDILESEQIGFFRLPLIHQGSQECEEIYQHFNHKKFFVHIGIGGSSLGPEMMIKALPKIKTNVNFTFINNVDPDDLYFKLKSIDLKNALFYVVSKSGTTAETIAALSIIINQLKIEGIKEEQFKDFFIFCTDPEKGDLRILANQFQIPCLTIPSNIGGRFSALTPVGLLPARFAGIDIQKILEGAQEIRPFLSSLEHSQHFFSLGAWILETFKIGIHQTVMMPYSSLLKEFSSWFVQLWAESLGKSNKGLTPIPAYGATDQHSQMQLFMEGPQDKNIFILEVEKFNQDFSLKSDINLSSFNNLSPFTLYQLFKAELEGTLSALNENQRHVIHLTIPELSEFYLGQLILFFECLTVYTGVLLEVDPFNQPGVEAGKRYAYSWLRNQGIMSKGH